MTVCIAAICMIGDEGARVPMIVLASDRQFTLGNQKYQPFQTKQVSIGPHATALYSGDVANCSAICGAAFKKIGHPPARVTKDIAYRFADAYAEYREAEAERALLSPIGLDAGRLVTDPTIYAPLRTKLVDEMRRYRLDEGFIVAGIDANYSAHIYSIEDPGWARLANASGFVAVGSGADHATALFLRHGYTYDWTPARAIFLAYSAKRHAEVDPFVGPETDMYVIGPGDNVYNTLRVEFWEQVHKVYEDTHKRELRLTGQAFKRYEDYVEQFLADQWAKTQHEGGVLASAEAVQAESAGESSPPAAQGAAPAGDAASES